MILAGDIGGTNCRLAIFDRNLDIIERQSYKSKDYNSFEQVVRDFLEHHNQPVESACFGIPGPVKEGHCKLTNLSWEIDAASLAAITKSQVTLLNDVEANAYGLETLGDEELVIIKPGRPIAGGNRAVVAPGTGLGEAALIEVEGRIQAIATEGGHSDFGPFDELQWGLLCYIQQEFKRVCYEVILSGPGLVRIYKYLIARGERVTPPWLAAQMEQGDAAAAISQAGLNGQCEVCGQAIDLFVAILAAESANVAVKYLATGGVYLGGGIPPRILDKLSQPLFVENFVNKDKIAHLLEEIPVYVILNDQTALQGAAWYSERAGTGAPPVQKSEVRSQ